jgi:hypothetical protein
MRAMNQCFGDEGEAGSKSVLVRRYGFSGRHDACLDNSQKSLKASVPECRRVERSGAGITDRALSIATASLRA